VLGTLLGTMVVERGPSGVTVHRVRGDERRGDCQSSLHCGLGVGVRRDTVDVLVCRFWSRG